MNGGSIEEIIYSTQRILILASVLVIATTVPVLSVAYYRQRRHPILKARRAEWSLLSQLFVMIASIAYGYDGWRHYPSCAQILFTNSVLAMLVFDSHIIRCWLLLYNWNVSKALCASRTGDMNSGRNWWLRNTHLASGKIMAKVMGALTLMHIGCWLIFIGINGWDQSWGGPADSAICTSGWLWFFGVWGALACMMAIAIYLTYNMRLVVDAFEIKNELMTIGGIWVVGAMPFWLIALIFPNLEQSRCYIVMLSLSVTLCALRVFYLSLAKPLLMINQENRQRKYLELSSVALGTTTTEASDGIIHAIPAVRGHNNLKKVDLRKMLDTNTGISGAFVNFLTKEFSVENWKLYSDVLQVRMIYGGWKESDAGRSGLESGHLEWFRVQEASITSLEEKINTIYNMYLAESAPFEVNLSSERLRCLRQCFEPCHLLKPECFNDIPERLCRAQDEIFELMRSDSFERFKKTAEFDHAQLALG